MRQVGDRVWVAEISSLDRWEPCPDCFGKKFLTVILGDDSRVTIDCAGCSSGYQPPRGLVKVYERKPEPRSRIISGMDIRGKDVTYHVGSSSSYRTYSEDVVFSTEGEALVRAQALAKEQEEDDLKRILQKEKDTRTWSWNATYHRRCLRDAKKQLAYHEEKLAAAKTHEKKKVITKQEPQ